MGETRPLTWLRNRTEAGVVPGWHPGQPERSVRTPSRRFRRRPSSTVEIGVAGLGYWGPNLLRVLSDMPEVRLSWLCDRDPDRLERFARRYPAVPVTSDVGDMLADPNVDAVVLATPVFTHFELGMAALAAGKHTFVEKPLACRSDLASQMLASAEAAGLVLMCGHTFIYSPAVRAVRRYIDEGAIGKVFFISSSRVNLGLHQRDISVVWDLGPHDFSILLHWLRESPETVRAIGRDSIVPGIADVAFITLGFASGVVANVELSWLAPSKLRRTVVVGSEKMVVYEDGALEPVRVYDRGVVYEDPETFGEYHLSYRTGDVLSPRLESHEPLSAEMTDFVKAVRTGASPLSGPALALEVVRITEAADESLRRDGEMIRIGSPAPEA
jgi:predicted dehydrogenase